jgi:hypothetical protein
VSWREPVKVLADVIQEELELDDAHIVLTNEKWPIPPDEGIYVAIGTMSVKVVGNNNFLRPIVGDAEEVRQIVVDELVQIDVMSFNSDARIRKEEILMALASQVCLRAQAEYQFQIARVPTGFVNASSLEETKILNRFTTTIVIKSIRTKVKTAEYYDQFAETEVHSNV